MDNKNKNQSKYTQFTHNSQTKVMRSVFNYIKKTSSIVTIIALVVLASNIYFLTKDVSAAGIDTVTTTLVTSAAVSTESQITVVFTPITALVPNDTITVYLGENSGGDPWVDTDGTIDNTNITCVQSGSTFDTYVQTDATATSPLLAGCDVLGVGGTN